MGTSAGRFPLPFHPASAARRMPARFRETIIAANGPPGPAP